MKRLLRQLDRLQPRWTVGVGVPLGLGLGAALLLAPSIAGFVAFVVVLTGALFLAASAEPISIPLEADGSPKPTHATQSTPEPSLVEGAIAVTEESDHAGSLNDYSAEPLLRWVSIPQGMFLMGSDKHEYQRLVNRVSISAFECMNVPVTRRLYYAVMGKNTDLPGSVLDDHPVNNVSWFNAIEFCNRWSARSSLSSCYQIHGNSITLDKSANGYRLLTEAEWEYACRAGSNGMWCFGDYESQLVEFAWYKANSGLEPHPVGRKKPNTWGLHDMHGNVWEWVGDWYGSDLSEPQIDPIGPNVGKYRVLRGGAFDVGPMDLRSAYRLRDEPENRLVSIGFRCARSPRRQPRPTSLVL